MGGTRIFWVMLKGDHFFSFVQRGHQIFFMRSEGGPEFFGLCLRGTIFFSFVQRGNQIFFMRSEGGPEFFCAFGTIFPILSI